VSKSELLVSLDTVSDMLADPSWLERATQVKTAKLLKQLLLDYCTANGKVVEMGEDLTCLYSRSHQP
jgi:hypothetical protein